MNTINSSTAAHNDHVIIDIPPNDDQNTNEPKQHKANSRISLKNCLNCLPGYMYIENDISTSQVAMALERTNLAWVRTATGSVAFGLAVVKLISTETASTQLLKGTG